MNLITLTVSGLAALSVPLAAPWLAQDSQSADASGRLVRVTGDAACESTCESTDASDRLTQLRTTFAPAQEQDPSRTTTDLVAEYSKRLLEASASLPAATITWTNAIEDDQDEARKEALELQDEIATLQSRLASLEALQVRIDPAFERSVELANGQMHEAHATALEQERRANDQRRGLVDRQQRSAEQLRASLEYGQQARASKLEAHLSNMQADAAALEAHAAALETHSQWLQSSDRLHRDDKSLRELLIALHPDGTHEESEISWFDAHGDDEDAIAEIQREFEQELNELDREQDRISKRAERLEKRLAKAAEKNRGEQVEELEDELAELHEELAELDVERAELDSELNALDATWAWMESGEFEKHWPEGADAHDIEWFGVGSGFGFDSEDEDHDFEYHEQDPHSKIEWFMGGDAHDEESQEMAWGALFGDDEHEYHEWPAPHHASGATGGGHTIHAGGDVSIGGGDRDAEIIQLLREIRDEVRGLRDDLGEIRATPAGRGRSSIGATPTPPSYPSTPFGLSTSSPDAPWPLAARTGPSTLPSAAPRPATPTTLSGLAAVPSPFAGFAPPAPVAPPVATLPPAPSAPRRAQ